MGPDNQSVSDAWDRQKETRGLGIRFYFSSEARDEHVNAAIEGLHPLGRSDTAPRCCSYAKPIPRNRLACVVCKLSKHFCFGPVKGIVAFFRNEHVTRKIEAAIAESKCATNI